MNKGDMFLLEHFVSI